MFGNTQELAENKLLLLYIFEKFQIPLSNTSITEIVLENNFLNYFQLQQYLSELVESGFLSVNRVNKKQIYTLSPKGKNVLEYFHNRISEKKKEIIEKYLIKREELQNSKIECSSHCSSESDGKYTVSCRLIENKLRIMELKIVVPSSEEAKKICEKWESNGSEIYNKIKALLT